MGTFEANVKCKNQEILEPVFVIYVDGRSDVQALNLVEIYDVDDGLSHERECTLQEYTDVFSV